MWAQTNLGVLYADGTGVRRNVKEAVRLFRLAAGQGHARAQNKLAWHLLQGRGVERNYEEAYANFRRAADVS